MAESLNQTETLLSALGGRGALPEALRQEALERFRETGLPTRRMESWKFTNLRALEALSFGAAEAEVYADRLPSLLENGAERLRLVYVNGRFNAELSDKKLPEGLEVANLAEGVPAWAGEKLGRIAESGAETPLLDLNTALAAEGPLLRVAKGTVLPAPIELLFLDAADGESASAAQWRGLILLEESAEATVIEQHASQGSAASFTNGALEISVGANAKLKHVRCQRRGERALELTNTQVRVERDGDYSALLVALGAALMRQDFRIRLVGAGAHCGLNGAYLLGCEQHGDITTVITHEAPHTTCNEAIKGALDGKSQGVFQGLIKVEKDSQQIEGNQSHHALLLSRTAEVDAKPELEIYADDVKCSHGATVGELDREALFYFRSRGIPERQARRMLIGSFLADVIEGFGMESVGAPLIALLEEKLDRMTGDEA
jgi:Fe-S cluster assembly protein SufD